MIQINLTNKWLYTFIALGIIIILAVGVYAYQSGGPPSEFGHSAEEIQSIDQYTADNIITVFLRCEQSHTSGVDCETWEYADSSPNIDATWELNEPFGPNSYWGSLQIACPGGYTAIGGGSFCMGTSSITRDIMAQGSLSGNPRQNGLYRASCDNNPRQVARMTVTCMKIVQ